jgi:hypothetical protein
VPHPFYSIFRDEGTVQTVSKTARWKPSVILISSASRRIPAINTMASRNGFRVIKFSVLLLTCLVMVAMDVDLEALQDSLGRTLESGTVHIIRQPNGTKIWPLRHRLGAPAHASSLFREEPFVAHYFETWFIRDQHQDDNDDFVLQPEDMFPADNEDLEGTNNATGAAFSSLAASSKEDRSSHLRVYLDLIASGQKGDFEK